MISHKEEFRSIVIVTRLQIKFPSSHSLVVSFEKPAKITWTKDTGIYLPLHDFPFIPVGTGTGEIKTKRATRMNPFIFKKKTSPKR